MWGPYPVLLICKRGRSCKRHPFNIEVEVFLNVALHFWVVRFIHNLRFTAQLSPPAPCCDNGYKKTKPEDTSNDSCNKCCCRLLLIFGWYNCRNHRRGRWCSNDWQICGGCHWREAGLWRILQGIWRRRNDSRAIWKNERGRRRLRNHRDRRWRWYLNFRCSNSDWGGDTKRYA